MNDDVTAAEELPGVRLRRMALAMMASQLGFTSDADFPTVYGVLTDWDVGGAIATILSMRDGTASLYTTSTFGIIGGHGHERVRQAAISYVQTAEQFAASGAPVVEYPYPGSGQVFYYLLTYDGVRRVVGSEAEIDRGSDPTWPLFAAAQDVLAELRATTER